MLMKTLKNSGAVALVMIWFIVMTAFVVPSDQKKPAKALSCKPGIAVLGSTNVNQFELRNNLSVISIKPCGRSSDSTALKSKKYWYEIPVKNFKTTHNQIYKDFLSLIKAEEYPHIRIGITLADLHRMLGKTTQISFSVDVSLAGNTNTYLVNCAISSCTDRSVIVTGLQKMKLSDFSILPPEKFRGLVKVSDEFLVNFDFVLTVA